MSKAPHWNDWADAATLIVQLVVYIPTLYIILVPWLCLLLVKTDKVPFLPGFFQAMAATGWLIASGLAVLAVLYLMLRSGR